MMSYKNELPFGLRMAKIGSEKATGKWRIGASLVDKGRIIIAWNSLRTSPAHLQNGYRFPDQSHAEFNLFCRTSVRGNQITDISPTPSSRGVVYVYRTDARGQLALARPCKFCLQFLSRAGIKNICYTIANGWQKEKI